MRKIRVTVGTVGYYDAKHAHKRMTAADGPFECEDTQAEHFVSAGVAEYVGGDLGIDVTGCKKKADYVDAIAAAEVNAGGMVDDEATDGDDLPDLNAADPE